MSYKTVIIGIILVAFTGCPPPPSKFSSNEITGLELQQHIKYLASDELKGRMSGEEGNRLAAQYIANEFTRYRLQPVGDHGTYFQSFEFLSSIKEGKHNSLSVVVNTTRIPFTLDKDFRPISFSSDTSVSSQLVFAGYGISADSLHYDDYSNIDVKNKIVVVLRYSPGGKTGDTIYTKYSPLMVKTYTARDKGASGIIFVSGPVDDQAASLVSFKYPVLAASGMAVGSMTWTAFDSILHFSGKDLYALQHEINSSVTPHSFVLPNVTVSWKTDVEKVYATTANILGLLEGSDPVLKDEVVVIGAHMDHLGMGGEGSGSLKPDTVAIHHGADDNASGTAGLLEAAQFFSAQRKTMKRSILFTSFSGEELGLLGSDYYTKHPAIPLSKTVAMLNMDMIGRMKDSTLVVEGMGTSPHWEELAKKENSHFSFNLKLKPDGFGPSDHASFYAKDIPVLFFFTNLHEDYHRPSDTWDKINYHDEQRVVDFVTRIGFDILNDSTRPSFTKVVASSPQPGGDRAGIQVSLGIMPDYADESVGLKISGTRTGSPAEKAGLKSGDIIVKFGGKDIRNIYDYMYLLGNYKAGDEVIVVIKRGNEEISMKATLEARKQ